MRHAGLRRKWAAGCVILGVLLLGGCTKEKALALKAAAEVFRDRAVAAIEYYEVLMVNGVLGHQQSDSEQLQSVLAQLKDEGTAAGKVTHAKVRAALDGTDARERALGDVRTQLADVRLAYVAYAGALARLPEGSFLAGDAVACAAALGVRLTQRLAVFTEVAAKAPVSYQYRFGRDVAELNRALAAKNDEAILKAVSDLMETRKAEKRDNALAVTMFADAIEAGTRTVGLAKTYGSLSVEDLLSGLNRILEIRTGTFGIDSTRAIERVKEFKAQIEEDPVLKPMLALPLTEPVPACATR